MAETTSLVIKVKSDSVGKATKDLKKLSTQAKVTATSTGKFGTTAKGIQPAMGAASKGIHGLNVSMKALAATTAALLIPLVALLAPFAIFKKLLTAGTSIGKFRAQLKTATGSVEQAAFQFQELTKFASETPFALEQSIEAFVKLKNLGLDPSESSMRSYGNTASAMGKDLSQMIEAVADATTGEFERLKEFGIKSSSAGDRVTFTFRGVATEVGKNAAEIEGYLKDLGEVEFAGAMADQMNTLGGRVSNLGDRWEQMWIAIAESGVDDWMGNLFDSMGGYFQIFEDLFTSGAIQAELESWQISFSLIWEAMKKGWKDAGDNYNDFAKRFGFDKTEGLMDGVLAAIRQVPIAMGGMMKVVGLFPDFMLQVGNLAGQGFHGMILAWTGKTAEAFQKAMFAMAETAQNPVKALWEKSQGWYKSPMDVFDESLKGDTRLDDLTKAISGVGKSILDDFGNRVSIIGVEMADAVSAAEAAHARAQALLGADRPDLVDPSGNFPDMMRRPPEEGGEMHGPDEQTKEELKLEKLATNLAKKQAIKDAAALEAAKKKAARDKAEDDQDWEDSLAHEKRVRAMKLEGAASLANGLSKLASHFGEKGAKAHKALAITSATIDMYAGATAAMADPTVGSTIAKTIMAAGVIANGMANIAAITSAGNYANGGIIPGTSTSGDRLQANVNSGEMILNQKQQANLFKQANSAGAGGSVTINNYGNDNVETRRDSDGNMEIIIRQAADLAKSELADEINTGDGDFAPMMQNTFGLSRGLA
jgi:hypothetical protein